MAETSKKRTVRIPLDYYKRPDRLSYWKLVLSAAAVLLAAGWASGFGWDFWSVSRWQARARGLASHGTLARSHATWDSQCEACHAPFRPIGTYTVSSTAKLPEVSVNERSARRFVVPGTAVAVPARDSWNVA